MKTLEGRVALLGAGRMGAALAAGWLRDGARVLTPQQLVVIDPSPSSLAQALIDDHGLTHHAAPEAQGLAEASIIILAVKPQILDDLAGPLAAVLPEGALVLSILAGVGLARLAAAFPDRPLIRAMPNTPAAIGAGITVAVADAATPESARAAADTLLSAAGAVEWIEDERLMSAVTAVSGSGPAYVFLLCEALAGAGAAEGLPQDLAERLAAHTVAGAGALIAERDDTAQALRQAVASPGGTTQAALDVLMGGGGLPALIRSAVAAAERRARQLGA